MLNDAVEAIRFLTIFKLPLRSESYSLARSMAFFPAVGVLIGVFSLTFFEIAESFFPARIATLFLLLAPILISGGLHVDGFADFCDGFFGGKDKLDVLRIMKDPHIGAWGTLGVASLMLTKFELLHALPEKTPFFLMAMATSRWTQVVLSFYLPYAGLGGGISEQVAGKTGRYEILMATLFLVPFLFWLRQEGVFILLGIMFSLCLFGFLFKKRIGGVTGDVLGATSEFTEILVLLLAIAFTRS